MLTEVLQTRDVREATGIAGIRNKEEMIETVHKHLFDRRRRRKRFLREIRHQVETCGYSVSQISDADLEAAVTHIGRRLEGLTPLTAKKTFWILRRLSPDVSQLRKRTRRSEKSLEKY